jgi:hypothetical protein
MTEVRKKTIGVKIKCSLLKELRDLKPEWKTTKAAPITEILYRERIEQLKKEHKES